MQPKTLENSLVIQAGIEGLTPQQVLGRDKLIAALIVEHDGDVAKVAELLACSAVSASSRVLSELSTRKP